jgi:predicted short-subunit dehydrogenase-like oxidoreductase (DUF2520 family)
MRPGTDRARDARLGVVGAGRLGTALASALRAAGADVSGPAVRGEVPRGCHALLLCVPDGELEGAAAAVAGAAPFVGHTSGATPLSALAPAARAGAAVFGLHPLQTFAEGAPVDPAGAGCAVAGSDAEALALAAGLARLLGMEPFAIEDDGRAAYHAAASMASNFLLALEASAERVACGAGLDRDAARALLAPLVRRSVENWAELGPERALTGPVARGDEATIRRQRLAVEAGAPDLLPLFDVLLDATRSLAAREVAA